MRAVLCKKTDYERAIRYYEAYYECSKNNKPRFTDPLEGIATIYEIRGEYRKAADTYKRIHENLIGEWGMSDESIVLETQKKIEKMLKKAEE